MPLMTLLFGQQDHVGNEGHKKSIRFNKITLNVFIHCTQFSTTYSRIDAR